MIKQAIRALLLTTTLAIFASIAAADGLWKKSIDIDDFDDSKTYTSALSDSGQGILVVRYHEKDPQEYDIYYVQSETFRLCGETGSILESSGFTNVQTRVDGGTVMTFTAMLSTDQKAIFLKDSRNFKIHDFVQSLKAANKVVIRFKDACHENGIAWIFGKFDKIDGTHHLSSIK